MLESAKLRVQSCIVPYVSQALRALMHLVPCALRAVVPHVPCALHALMLHMSGDLRALLPHVSRDLRASCPTCSGTSCALHPTCSHASCTSYLTYPTVNHYDKQPLLQECYWSGYFHKWYRPPDPLIYINLITLIHQPAFISKLALWRAC